MKTTFCELKSAGLIAFSGEDATSFLHAQVTSDVTGLAIPHTQYSGYCSPKGRLLRTFLLWRREKDILLQLPAVSRETLQTRLTKYVLRAHVSVKDATADHALFGISGDEGGSALRALGLALPNAPHDVVSAQGLYLARLPLDRYFLLSGADDSARVRAALAQSAQEDDESSWSRLDIEAGIPVITSESEDQYIPQMVNLDLIGGVSYTKGCYPGQEIVARTHYLGRLKQRMYRIRVPLDATMRPGDPLFSPQFGEQASGTIVQAALTDAGEYHALAVIQTAAADSGVVRLKSPGGPAIEFLSLPYALPS